MNAFIETRHLSAPNAPERPSSCRDRPSVSGIQSLPCSFSNPGRFLRRNRVICSLHGQAAIAERMPDRGAAYWSWLSHDSSEMDDFGGWCTVSPSENASPNGVYLLASGLSLSTFLHGAFKIPGFPHGGAGIILAISFALAACLAFSRKGLTFRDLTVEKHSHSFSTPASSETKQELQYQKATQVKEGRNSGVGTGRKILTSKSIKAVSELVSRLWIPGCKEPLHEQALSVLQSLKIAEASCPSVDLCTRREYARWLVLASNLLCRKPSERICPATYVKGTTSLAFDDILAEDQDFPYIQGMAEAGLIGSKLDISDSNGFDSIASDQKENKDNALFLPDSCVCRQDIVSWKIALDHRFWWRFEEKIAERKPWYFDIEHIPRAARSAILLDLYAGEKSIAASAFGYTRRFQPEHPVTHGQAALAIISGEMAAAVSEEIANLQEENSKNEGIIKELMSEAYARKEQDAEFKKLLAELREKRVAIETMAEAIIQEANIFKNKRWNETLSFERELAAIELEKILLSRTRDNLLERINTLSVEETNIQLDRKRLVEMKAKAEKKKHALLQRGCKAKAEMRAVTFARVWTEDQAKRALAYAKTLEQSKGYWGKRVNKESFSEKGKEEERSPVTSTSQHTGEADEGLTPLWQFDKESHDVAKQKTRELLQEIKEKSREMQSNLSIVAGKVGEFHMRALQRIHQHLSNYASSSFTNSRK